MTGDNPNHLLYALVMLSHITTVILAYYGQIQERGGGGKESGPPAGNWLATRIADLTHDLQVLFSWGSNVVSFHSQQQFSVGFFHVSLGLRSPTYHQPAYHRLFWLHHKNAPHVQNSEVFSLKMGSRSSNSSVISRSLDLTVATSSGMILQICLSMALALEILGRTPSRSNISREARTALSKMWNTLMAKTKQTKKRCQDPPLPPRWSVLYPRMHTAPQWFTDSFMEINADIRQSNCNNYSHVARF